MRSPIKSGMTGNEMQCPDRVGDDGGIMKFKIDSEYKPSGDQPAAIEGICSALNSGVDAVTLLGVTGSGKTFTMANVIEKLQRPALILSHNKTLAAQLYGEF